MKPYIICYMMMSLDGRVDCAMTEKLKGTAEYYDIMRQLDIDTTLCGRVTAEAELALPGRFTAEDATPCGKTCFSKKISAKGYEIILDTKGSLLWGKETGEEKPRLIITSEDASAEYLRYLDGQNISWIACGKGKIDLAAAMEILAAEFGVQRLGVVGGPAVNTSFLNAGLLDEADILIGPGIDGRADMPSVFEGRTGDEPLQLKLMEVNSYKDGAVLLRYKTA